MRQLAFHHHDARFSRHAEAAQLQSARVLEDRLPLRLVVDVVAVDPHATESDVGGDVSADVSARRVVHVLGDVFSQPVNDDRQTDLARVLSLVSQDERVHVAGELLVAGARPPVAAQADLRRGGRVVVRQETEHLDARLKT